jgi:pimeloyl-ACP methyl ester carboxylesterase
METTVSGLRVHFDKEGKGQALLLLHGWANSLDIWDVVLPGLMSHFTVFRLDFPGFGQSQLPREAWGTEEYADFTEKFILKMKIARPIIVGHSFGGRVGIVLASRKEKTMKKLVLVGAAGVTHDLEQKRTIITKAAKAGKAVFSLPILSRFAGTARQKFYEKIGSSDYLKAGPLKETYLKVIAQDLRPLLSKITVPTLVLWGEKDTEAPVAAARIIKNEVKNARLVIFGDSGHFPFVDRPDQFVREIERFSK